MDPGSKGIFTSDTSMKEGADLSDGKVNDENGSLGGKSGVGGDGDDDPFFQDKQECVASKQIGPLPEPYIERRAERLTEPPTAEGSTRENAVVIHDDQGELDTDTDDEEGHHPQQDNADTQEYLSNERLPVGMQNAINSEMAEEVEARVNSIPPCEPTATPPGPIKKTVTFANAALLENHEADHTSTSRSTRATGDQTVPPRKKGKTKMPGK